MEPFKNEFSYLNALRISSALARVDPNFPTARFRRGLEIALEPLELKQRMHLIADRLEACLPLPTPQLFQLLVQTLAKDEADSQGLRGFIVWPLTEIVARRGLEFFDDAMLALRAMTSRFTAEFAIRPFLRRQLQRTLQQLEKWGDDPDPHVRRLVSEGSRPFLPWGERLPEILADPQLTLGLLERLHRDPSPYVRLSVANHLNDFSKAHPDLVIKTLSRWQSQAPDCPHIARLTRHACRTLIKQGHPTALALHGYGSAENLSLEEYALTETSVALGGSLGYRLVVKNRSSESLRVLFDYAILHCKANGTQTPKVFKGRQRTLAPGEIWQIQARHSFKIVTTRVYHPGLHGFEPRLNGKAFPHLEFLVQI